MGAVREKCPVTIFLISGIIPLVPGAGIYWSAFYMVTDQLAEAGEAGFAAVKAAIAIVLGIVCVFELPQGVFRFVKRISRPGYAERAGKRNNILFLPFLQ